MYFRHKFFTVILLTILFLPDFADALVFQDSEVALRNGMYETGYQERKAKERAQRKIEEADKAKQINFSEPNYSSSVENNHLGGSDNSVIAMPSDGIDSKDYNTEVANHLFGKQDKKEESKGLYIVYFNTPSQSIILTPERVVEIHFLAPKKILWHFEKSSEIFKYIDQRQEKDVFILTYQAMKVGDEKLYFDALEYKGDNVNVLESKVLNIKVR